MSSRAEASKVKIEERRNRVARLYCEGKTQLEIGKQVGISKPTVCRDLKEVRKEWLEQRTSDVEQRALIELAKIDNLEAEAWDSYHKSKAPAVETKTETPDKAGDAPAVGKVTKTIRDRLPETQFLDVVRWCIEQRCKMLGLLAPTKIAPTNASGTESFKLVVKGMSDAELDAIAIAAERTQALRPATAAALSIVPSDN